MCPQYLTLSSSLTTRKSDLDQPHSNVLRRHNNFRKQDGDYVGSGACLANAFTVVMAVANTLDPLSDCSFNEPHYKDYIHCDLGGLFSSAGFDYGTKWQASASKSLSFIKPL